MARLFIVLGTAMLFAGRACGLGAHEVALLINGESEDSLAIGAAYASMRHIPEANVVRLRVPNPGVSMSAGQFGSLVWEPASRALAGRGLGGQILAWVFSAGFPVRVDTAVPVSVCGAVFVRGRIPDGEAVDKARYVSPLYAGPDRPGARDYRSQTFDAYREWLGEDMPLPCMMLGYTGPRGNTRAEVLASLADGVRSDGSRPSGKVFLVTGDDVRARCRQWQFVPVERELAGLGAGIVAVVTNRVPSGCTNIAGILMGAAEVSAWAGNRFVPGAVADHLTSMAAAFDNPYQTKLSHWIREGAVATAGTVTEPYSAWPKFPSARLFVHLAAGCTVVESLYQSIRSPLQILLVGDPLACPWRPAATLRLMGLEGGLLERRGSVTPDFVAADSGCRAGRYVYLLDGRLAGSGRRLELDPAVLAPGAHRLRCVAYASGMVRSQWFVEQPFEVRR